MFIYSPEGEDCIKHFEKRRKSWKPAFSPYTTMFSTFSEVISFEVGLMCLLKRICHKQVLSSMVKAESKESAMQLVL